MKRETGIVDDQRCCQAKKNPWGQDLTGACQTTYKPRKALTDARIDAVLNVFFTMDWDINGVLTAWDIMAYMYRYKSTHPAGAKTDVFGNYRSSYKNCWNYKDASDEVERIIGLGGAPEAETHDAEGYPYLTLEIYLNAVARSTDFGVMDIWFWLFRSTHNYDMTVPYYMDLRGWLDFVEGRAPYDAPGTDYNWEKRF